MIFQKTNIQDKLSRLRDQEVLEERVLKDVYHILEHETKKEEKIAKTLATPGNGTTNSFVFDALETERIYHIDQLKKICIDYRLRFLDSKYFKGKIPNAAIAKIKALEKEHNTELKGFKIMAPSKL